MTSKKKTKHIEKVKLARRLNNGKKRGAFLTDAWARHAQSIKNKVLKTKARMKKMAEERRKRKLIIKVGKD